MTTTAVAEKKPSISPGFIAWLGFVGILLIIGLVSAVMVFWKGLVITNMSDTIPWGLWITIDLSSIALGAGAFTLSAIVYILDRALSPDPQIGSPGRINWVYIRLVNPGYGYWTTGSFLPPLDLLECTFGVMGNHLVYYDLSVNPDIRIFTCHRGCQHVRSLAVGTQGCRYSTPGCHAAGHHRSWYIAASPILPGRGIRHRQVTGCVV